MIKDELVDLNSDQSEDEDVLRFSLVLDIDGFYHLERQFTFNDWLRLLVYLDLGKKENGDALRFSFFGNGQFLILPAGKEHHHEEQIKK